MIKEPITPNNFAWMFPTMLFISVIVSVCTLTFAERYVRIKAHENYLRGAEDGIIIALDTVQHIIQSKVPAGDTLRTYHITICATDTADYFLSSKTLLKKCLTN